MSKVYFISDIHFGHYNICRYRNDERFSSWSEHDNFILENILKTIGKRDTLWILGDCFFTEEAYNLFFDNVFCHKINWIIGNHDTDNQVRVNLVKRFCKETHPMYGKIGSLFSYKRFWLSHHPIHPMELRGKRNIHGHTHNFLMLDDEGNIDDRYVNVCCEHVDYTPIPFEKIVERYETN